MSDAGVRLEGLRVALLFGGRSTEHEVSLRSARFLDGALSAAGAEVVPVAVDGAGRWLAPEISRPLLDDRATRRAEAPDGAPELRADLAGRGLFRLGDPRDGERLAVDALFPIVHGWGGEDGRLQGAFELAGLAYAGPGLLGSALAMDKSAAKDVLDRAGLPTAPAIEVRSAEREREPSPDEALARRVERELGWPVFVKPVNGGSSVGIARVERAADLGAALDDALRYDVSALVERGLDAQEVECAVLEGPAGPETSGLGEIVPRSGFYDYAAKYLDDSAELRVPADLPPHETEALRRAAGAAFRALRLEGFARVDFLVEKSSRSYYINEVNTLPGFTEISMFPKLWEASGVAGAELVARIVRSALDRARRRARLATRWEGEAKGEPR